MRKYVITKYVVALLVFAFLIVIAGWIDSSEEDWDRLTKWAEK